MDAARVITVMYHYVRDRAGTPEADIRGLDTATFRRQLDRLCAWLEPVTWPMVYAWLRGKGSIPQRCFLLSFDDGLSDHAEVVAPILEDSGLRGVFFVPGRVLHTGRMDSAQQIHVLQTTLGDERFAQCVAQWLETHQPDDDWPAQVDAAAAATTYHYEDSTERATLEYLLAHTLPIDLRNAMIDELFSRHVPDRREIARRWYLDPQQIVLLNQAGHTIGGHGFAHEPYTRLTPARQSWDLKRSAEVLDSLLGPGIRPFSFPYGSFDEAAARRCAQAGFVQAFTTRPGWITAGQDVFQLNRVDTIDADAFVEGELLCATH